MRRLLLVEDDDHLRCLLSDALEEALWDVTNAGSGDEAAAILDTGATFEALVTDVRMPGRMDGINLARKARRGDGAMKIVVISGFTGTQIDQVTSERLGNFLPKPFTITQLEARLN